METNRRAFLTDQKTKKTMEQITQILILVDMATEDGYKLNKGEATRLTCGGSDTAFILGVIDTLIALGYINSSDDGVNRILTITRKGKAEIEWGEL